MTNVLLRRLLSEIQEKQSRILFGDEFVNLFQELIVEIETQKRENNLLLDEIKENTRRIKALEDELKN